MQWLLMLQVPFRLLLEPVHRALATSSNCRVSSNGTGKKNRKIGQKYDFSQENNSFSPTFTYITGHPAMERVLKNGF